MKKIWNNMLNINSVFNVLNFRDYKNKRLKGKQVMLMNEKKDKKKLEMAYLDMTRKRKNANCGRLSLRLE